MRSVTVAICLAAVALAAGTTRVGADVRILHYDQSGRVKGVDQLVPDGDRPETTPAGPTGARARFEPGEVLVVDPPENLRRQLAQLDFSVIDEYRFRALDMGLLRLRVPAASDVPAALNLLRQRFPGAVADANHLYDPAAGAAAGEALPASWVRSVIGWPLVDTACGRGLRLGMIDATVDTRHPALIGQRLEFRSFHSRHRRPADADHGTAVAAILIGRPSDGGWGGILPGAELKAANMFEFNEAGRLVGNAVALLKALDWMAQERVRVVNLSMAGADNKALRFAVERARKKGLIMVAAAGNWGSAEQPAYPAAYDHVIAVTAFGSGGGIYSMANRGPYIDFAAPGVKLWTAVPAGGRYQSGTSFASPYVSAQVAAVSARVGIVNALALRNLLREQAVDMGSPGRDDTFGWGFVDQAPSCAL